MTGCLAFYGKFLGRPFPYSVSRANTMAPQMAQAEDFESLSRIPKPINPSPVLCSFSEKYLLLEQLIIAAFAHLHSLDRCVMTAMMPGGVRLPARLLMEDIFLVHHVNDEAERLLQGGCSVLVIEESIIRHPLEAGDNSLHLRWLGAEHATARLDWSEFLLALSELNIMPACGA
ncbi:hypothetical protein [Aeromonas hydrophila]|uniref:hypothetical protein n=1 Tax=Aeromonas hydrophila TaxID=644 RepID=UPI00188DD24C|nr:hypothetical protein [Aeromonas hydrophila]MBF4801475.1 hypothetical protein [Aeromonas hydrophila]